MSFATDLLAEAALKPAVVKPVEGRQRMTGAQRAAIRSDVATLHMARVPGVRQVRSGRADGRWEARFHKNDAKGKGSNVYLGLFRHPVRAYLAVKLWRYWKSQGFRTNEIPQEPHSRTAYR